MEFQFSEKVASNVCYYLAPQSTTFSDDVYKYWGAGGIAFLVIPAVLTLVMLGIYAEEVYYIFLKGDSKELVNSLCWLLGTYPAIMVIGTIAIFIPRAVVYLSFIYAIFVAYAIYKYYYLLLVYAGGTKPFVDKSASKPTPLNLIPCCCLVCLPSVHNSMRITATAKWFILQNAIATPLYGALAVLLKSDWRLYSRDGVSASVYLSLLNALSTLVCMYGFNLIAKLTRNIDGMEEVHTIKGKTRCMQLVMLITGFEGIIFNVLAQLGVFPCTPPLNFTSRRKVIYNYAVVLQVFFLGLLARHYFRRHQDIQRQATLNDDITLGEDQADMVYTAVDAYQHRSYNGAGNTSQGTTASTTVDELRHDDVSSTSA